MIDVHGDEADLKAAIRARKLEAAGDDNGCRRWESVWKAIDELQRSWRHEDEVLN